MAQRKLGPFMVEGVGLGCMSLSYAYGVPPSDADGEACSIARSTSATTISTPPRCTGWGITRR